MLFSFHGLHFRRATPTRISRPKFLRGAAVAVVIAALGTQTIPAHAGFIPFGTVLVSGSQWAGADAGLGDLNVYSNGTQKQDRMGTFGYQYECTELVQRWAHYKFGEPAMWPARSAADMWNAGPTLPIALLQHPNGGSSAPQFGDIIVYAATSSNPTGHVAVVSGVNATSVTAVHQNYTYNGTLTGEWTQSMTGTNVAPLGGDAILGWLRPAGSGGGDQTATGDQRDGPAAIVSTSGGDQTLFWKGTTRTLYEAWSSNGSWSPPVSVSGAAAAPMASEPSAAVTGSGQQIVFWEGTDGRLHEMWWQSSNGWNGPVTVAGGSAVASAPSIIVTASNQTVFWEALNGQLEEAWWDSSTGWNGPVYVPGAGGMTSSPSAINSSSTAQTVFWKGSNGELEDSWWTPSSGWNGPVPVTAATSMATAPSAMVTASGEQIVFWQGPDRSLHEATWSYPSWTGPLNDGSGPLGSSPSADITAAGKRSVFWKGTDANIWTVGGNGGGSWSSPANPGMMAPIG